MNFHGLGTCETSPNGAARLSASMAIWIVSVACVGVRTTPMRRTLPSALTSSSSTGIASRMSGARVR